MKTSLHPLFFTTVILHAVINVVHARIVSHWALDDPVGSATVVDETGHHPGTVNGGVVLGTTKSAVGIWEGSRPRILPAESGSQSIPSLVMVTPDEEIYAGLRAARHPDRYDSKNITISSVKRMIGSKGETGWGWWKSYPQEVSSFILSELKQRAESLLDDEASRAVIGPFRDDCEGFHFEPTARFYETLGTDDEKCLQGAASEVASHLGLPTVPPVDFDWGIKMDPQHAGEVRFDHPEAPIRIPFQYAGRAYVLGAILAHELCHVFMTVRRIRTVTDGEYEPLTDLTTVCAGLGKLSLNGTLPDCSGNPTVRLQLGYLPHDLLVYAYGQVNNLKGIPRESARLHLRPEIQI